MRLSSDASTSVSANASISFLSALPSSSAAMLFSNPIDSLAAAGAVLADVWLDAPEAKMPVVDSLGDEFLEYVRDGMNIIIQDDGKVLVSDPF